MPLYEYQCPKCGRFEVIRKFSDLALKKCPTCGKAVRKLASAPAIQFKGAGWYVTDYAKKPSGEAASEAASKGDRGKPESAKTESAKADSSSPAASSDTNSSTSEATSAKPAKPKEEKASSGRTSK